MAKQVKGNRNGMFFLYLALLVIILFSCVWSLFGLIGAVFNVLPLSLVGVVAFFMVKKTNKNLARLEERIKELEGQQTFFEI